MRVRQAHTHVVLSFLVFSSPFDSLRSRIAPFTFYALTYSLHHVSLHYTTHLCTFSPSTTPLPNGRMRSLIIDWLYTTLHTIVTHTSYGFRQKLIHTQSTPIDVHPSIRTPAYLLSCEGLRPTHLTTSSTHIHNTFTQTYTKCIFSHQFSRFLSPLLHIIYNIIIRIL